jgi:class 3 adenylate cyclase
MICATCKSDQPDGNRFCGQCGAALAEPEDAPAADAPRAQPSPAGERRQMTILFYDLVNSTSLATRSDPEDFSEAIESFHRHIGAAVRSLGGFVGSRVGDGAVVYFGYPHAQEDAAERAVLAGLRAVDVAGEVRLPDGEIAQARVGIATGQGVVSRLEDEGGGNEVVGSVANLAARLQAVAAPGCVVVSDATRRLLRGLFELDDLGGVHAKGFQSPVRAWRVVADSQRDGLEALDPVQDTPVVGRVRETEQLASALREASAGKSRVVLLTGDAGLGKSRLAGEFARRAEADGVRRISLHCSAHSQEAPLRPFIRQLQRANNIDADTGGGHTELNGLAPETGSDDAALIARLLGFSATESAAIRGLSPAQRLDQTIEALIQQVQLFSRRDVVLVVFEDAHWADPTSMSLLERVVRSPRLGRVLILITARPEFRPNWLADPHVDEIALRPMGSADAAEMIYRIAGSHGLAPAVRRAILDRADGVPLFIEELTRSTLEIAADSGGDLNAELDLPMTLQDSLLARLDRLGPAKHVAQVAAVIGRRFPTRLLESLCDLRPDERVRALQRLADSGLITQERSSEYDAYAFRHVLVQETAYGTLLRAERRRLNARLLEIIASDYPALAASEPERLAHYATEAGNAEAAAEYWLRAGVQALAQTAMAEASSRLRRGLAMVAKLPQEPRRWRIELKLELALGKALIATIGYALPQTGATFARAKVLCEAIGEKPELLAVLHGLWIHDLLCGRLPSARTRADELLQLAEAEQDDSWTLIGCRARGVLGYPLGEFELSRRLLERGLSLFAANRRADYAQVLVDDPRVVMLMYLSWILIYLGHEDEGRAAIEACVGEARELGQPYNLAHALAGRVLTGLFQEDYQGLAAVIEELANLTREHEIAYYAAVCEVLRGRYLVGTGQDQEGARVLEAALQTYRGTSSILYLPTFMMWRADALGRTGHIEEGLELIHQARALMDQTGMQNDAAEIRRTEGELHRLAGNAPAARRAFKAALKMAEQQKATLFSRRALSSLAALPLEAGAARAAGQRPVRRARARSDSGDARRRKTKTRA